MTKESGLPLPEVEKILLQADAAHQPVPAAVDEQLIYYYRHRYGLRPEVNAALHRLAPERFARFSKQLKKALAEREKELTASTEIAFAEWANDPALEKEWIAGIVRNASEALRKNNFYAAYHTLTSMFESALGGSEYAVALFDRALAELATIEGFATSSVGALLRLMFQRVRCMALRGTPRALDAAMPGADIRYVHTVDDGIGKDEPLSGLATAQINSLFAAWSALDWDSTLGLPRVFDRDSSPPALETRPWAELVDLVGKTSLHRLESGERGQRTLSRLFGRPEPIADRIALAESIAVFAKPHGSDGQDAMLRLLSALVPHVAVAGRELTGALEAAAYKAFRDGELKEVLLTLPARQVSAWIDKLVKAKSAKHKALGKAYADAVARR